MEKAGEVDAKNKGDRAAIAKQHAMAMKMVEESFQVANNAASPGGVGPKPVENATFAMGGDDDAVSGSEGEGGDDPYADDAFDKFNASAQIKGLTGGAAGGASNDSGTSIPDYSNKNDHKTSDTEGLYISPKVKLIKQEEDQSASANEQPNKPAAGSPLNPDLE